MVLNLATVGRRPDAADAVASSPFKGCYNIIMIMILMLGLGGGVLFLQPTSAPQAVPHCWTRCAALSASAV
jgi:ABC-type uncharacterized transport system permease subunit